MSKIKKEKKKNKPNYTLSFFKYLIPFKKQLILAFSLLVIAIGAGLCVPYLNSIIVNDVIKNADYSTLTFIIITVLVLMVLESLLVFIQSRTFARIGFKVAATIRQDLFERIEKFDISFFDKYTSGDILQRVTNYVDEFASFLSNYLIIFAVNGFKLVLVLAFMVSLSGQLTLVVIVSIVVNFIFLFALKNIVARKSSAVKKQEAFRANAVINSIKNRKLIKAYNREENDIKQYEKIVNEYTHFWMKFVNINEIFVPGVELLWYLGAVVLYFVSLILIDDSNIALTIGAVIAFNGYITQMTTPLIQLGTVLQQIGGLEGASNNVFSLIDAKQFVEEDEQPLEISTIESVSLKNVTFSKGRKKLVDNLSVDIIKGETVAFVSAERESRNSIVKLVLRYVDTKSGELLINGVSIKKVKITSLRNQIVSMDKIGHIFNTTVMDNIRYANDSATEVQVVEVAKLTGAHKFIVKLKLGYDTILDNNSNLSVGQRQSLGFARVLLHKPSMYIFDDITMDAGQKVKSNVVDTIKTVLKEQTVVIISDDEEMLEITDKVVFLGKNEIIIDTHTNLMNNENYRRIIEE